MFGERLEQIDVSGPAMTRFVFKEFAELIDNYQDTASLSTRDGLLELGHQRDDAREVVLVAIDSSPKLFDNLRISPLASSKESFGRGQHRTNQPLRERFRTTGERYGAKAPAAALIPLE